MRSPTARRRVPARVRPRRTLAVPVRLRPALATLVVIPVLAIVGQPAIATADTAHVKVAKRDGAVYPTRIVLTTPTGASRTLGPFRLRSRTSGLSASPDGRYLVLVPEPSARNTSLTVVSLEDGSSSVLRAPRGITIVSALPMISWATDGSELVLDHALVGGPESDPVRWSVLRCAAPVFACQEVEDSVGAAATIPGGIVTGSTLLSVFPSSRAFGVLVSIGDGDHWFTRRSASARELRRLVSSPVVSQITTLVDGRPRTVSTTRRTPKQGIPVTTAIVGGVSGALLSQELYRVAVRSRGDRIRGKIHVTQRRLVRVTPDGATRTTAVPRLTIPRTHTVRDPITGRSRAESAPVTPGIGLPSGGWLATAGTQPSLDYALTLARIDADGTARFVRTGGRIVSASSLVTDVEGAPKEPGLAGLEIVGYEQATDAAIVVVRWWESGRKQPAAATVRVPLDERTAPTVLSRLTIGTAW